MKVWKCLICTLGKKLASIEDKQALEGRSAVFFGKILPAGKGGRGDFMNLNSNKPFNAKGNWMLLAGFFSDLHWTGL